MEELSHMFSVSMPDRNYCVSLFNHAIHVVHLAKRAVDKTHGRVKTGFGGASTEYRGMVHKGVREPVADDARRPVWIDAHGIFQ